MVPVSVLKGEDVGVRAEGDAAGEAVRGDGRGGRGWGSGGSPR
jgi:hypothetical protein